MLLSLLLGILATLIIFPEIAMARALHRFLVEPLTRRMSEVRLGHILFAAGLTAIGAVLILAFEGEGLKLFTLMAPDAVGWFAMFDVSLFIDVFAITLAVAATTRLKAIRDQIVVRAGAMLTCVRSTVTGSRQRARRDKSITARPKRSNDPDPFGASYAFG